jgi:hypothetical protein
MNEEHVWRPVTFVWLVHCGRVEILNGSLLYFRRTVFSRFLRNYRIILKIVTETLFIFH